MTTTPTVGSVWVSRDKRDEGKRVTVVKVDESFAWVRFVRTTRVRLPLERLYTPAPKGHR